MADYGVILMVQLARAGEQVTTASELTESTGLPGPTVSKLLKQWSRSLLLSTFLPFHQHTHCIMRMCNSKNLTLRSWLACHSWAMTFLKGPLMQSSPTRPAFTQKAVAKKGITVFSPQTRFNAECLTLER